MYAFVFCPLWSSVGACRSRIIISHQSPVRVKYIILSLVNYTLLIADMIPLRTEKPVPKWYLVFLFLLQKNLYNHQLVPCQPSPIWPLIILKKYDLYFANSHVTVFSKPDNNFPCSKSHIYIYIFLLI